MSLVLGFGLQSCKVSEESQNKIEVLLQAQVDLVADLKTAYKKHKNGELTTEELLTLKDDITDNISETKAEVLKLKESGIGWAELIGAVVMGVISRGIPSKGILSTAFGMMTRRREDDS